MTTVAVLGAGSWGTTLAHLLAAKGERVRLWAYEAEVAAAINRSHENPLFLPGRRLDDRLEGFTDLAETVAGAPFVVCAAPSHACRTVLSQVGSALAAGAVLVSATKGIESDSLLTMSRVAAQVVPGIHFVALSGPSFAQEVFDRQPTAVVAASSDREAAQAVQALFSTSTFRVYSNSDVLGTELAASLKNVIAIAAGVLDGLGLGNNPRAALITRGLAEMARLGHAVGADPRTFAGLAGMGDLILTACGALSRNRSLGVALAAGTTVAQYQQDHRTVAEGVNTARAAVRLAERHGVELPIAAQVASILFDGKPVRQAMTELMERTLKPEQWV